MQKYVALLRGINVSGQKKIKMEELRKCLSETGFKNIQTYIQSGNIVFDSNDTDQQKLSVEIEKVILSSFGFEVPVVVIPQVEFQRVLVSNPFLTKEVDTKMLYVGFLFDSPELNLMEDLRESFDGKDKYEIVEGLIFMSFVDGLGSSKMNNNFFERKLKVRATTRNWNTVNKLASF